MRPLTPVVAITMSARCMSDSSATPSPPEAMSRFTAFGFLSLPRTHPTPHPLTLRTPLRTPVYAQAPDRERVGGECDGGAAGWQIDRPRPICLAGQAAGRHARGIDIAQNLPGVDRQARRGADLAAAVAIEHPVRLA